MTHPLLHPYQQFGAKFLADRKNAMLADSMGVGKTAQAIGACDILKAKKVLVVVPGISRENWAREFAQWSIYKRTIGIVYSTKQGVPNTDIVIVSYSILASRTILQALLTQEWDVLICDEAHLVKSRKAVRTKCVYGAKCDAQKGLASRAKHVYLLTGTPIPNNLSEVWTHARALFPAAVAQYEKFDAWAERFCTTHEGRINGNKNLNDFTARMKPFILRRTLTDVAPEMPPLTYAQVVIAPEDMPAATVAESEAEIIVRNAVAKRMQDEDRHGELTEDDLRAIEVIAGMHTATNKRHTGVCKAKAAAELIRDDLEGGMNKIVVWAIHRDVIDILHRELPGSRYIDGRTKDVEDNLAVDMFQGKIPGQDLRVLIIQMNKGSTALTLTAAHEAIAVETSWSRVDLKQAAGREYRQGQTKPVRMRVLSLAGSIDEVVGRVMTRKENSINKIEVALTTKEGLVA